MVAFVLAALITPAPTPSVRIGASPPPFAQLAAAHGKTVVLNFWATWCKPCTDEMKYLTQAQQQFGDRIAIITISSEPHDVAASYLRLNDLDLPLIEDLDGSLGKLYRVPPIPLTVVVNPDGAVSHISFGELDPGELQKAIEQDLATPPAGSPSPGVLR